MKVVHAINSLSLGGAEIFVAQLASKMSRRVEVQVWTYAGAQDASGREMQRELEGAGVRVRSINVRRRQLKVIVPLVWRRWIAAERPDIINAHLDQSELFISLASAGMRTRPVMVRTLHNSRIAVPLARRVQPWIRRHFDFDVACSPAVLASPALDLRHGRSRAIPNGIVLPEVSTSETRTSARRKLGLAEDRTLLLCIGSMNKRGGELQKAQDSLLRGFASARSRARTDLVLLGDGSQRSMLERLSHQLGIHGQVQFWGAVKPEMKWHFIHACDAAVIFSRFEGLPITGIEFGCAGLPMLLSDITELSPFVGKGSIVATEQCLPQAIDALIAGLPRLRAESSIRSVAYRQAYSIETSANAYYELYWRLLRLPGTPPPLRDPFDSPENSSSPGFPESAIIAPPEC